MSSNLTAFRDDQQNDWQPDKSTVRERNAHMFNNEFLADVHFVVGANDAPSQETIPAHKYVLATASSVFCTMFYGEMASGDVIHTPDIEPEVFKNFLR